MSTAVLEATDIVKHYGSVEALRGASFDVRAGEVVALIGDNGAGKSTLVKCLVGAEQPTSGTVRFEGREVRFDSPVAARAAGIETVYQDLAVAPDLDPAANLFLGREIYRPGLRGMLGMIDKTEMKRRAAAEFDRLGIVLQDMDVPIGSLSGGQRQSVAVARSVVWASKVVFMDEPTAALGVLQRERVLDVIRRVRDEGIAVVLISHNMPEVLAVSDRVEVLRLGRRVARFTAAEVTLEDLVGAMTGALTQEEPA
ncbi:ATP-binding cassette domain-containing protein [Actinophytocola sp.]|uniref:ATP-binding cassette domain-containing protein n=1 Tax=Actinophytocola sp. TaxID=1872138 RepID=UPI002D7F98AB|nr:ATP-binding cassette domain-containing protein [Actinophytocola sp.]HET9142872.1 ATP-binding cassette domain-containing protein [Actinophytocola sp.]